MAKRSILVGILLGLLLTLIAVLAVNAQGDGAAVIKDFYCFISPPASGLSESLWTDDTHSVTTPSGRTILTCHFDVPDGLYNGPAMRYEGFLCGTLGGLTTDSRSVVNRNRVTLVCRI